MNNEFIIVEFSEPWMNDPFDVERDYEKFLRKMLDYYIATCSTKTTKGDE